MTALGSNPITPSEPGEPVVLPLSRTLALELSELRVALAESPRTRITHRAAWPLFFTTIVVGFVGAHFGKPSYAANAVAVLCLLVRFLPGMRARAARERENFVEHVTLSTDGLTLGADEHPTHCSWERASYYESSLGLVVVIPGRSIPCVLLHRCFAPAEFTRVRELVQSRAKRVDFVVDLTLLSVILLLTAWVAWRTWHLAP